MQETRTSLVVDGLEMPAAFTVPENAWAALLLIPGSANSDLDGNFAPMFPGQPAMNTHVYRDLAEQLATRGVAVLRYSKSGPGTGAVARDPELMKEKYGHFRQRVRVAAAFLEELRRRCPDAALAVAGHSEGAVVATLLVQQHSEVGGLVLLSGPAKPLLQLMMWQRFVQAPRNAESEVWWAQADAWAADYAAGRPLPADFGGNPYADMIPFFLQTANRPYLHSLEQVNPAAELKAVRQPVLIVQGGRDASVLAENAELLQQARPAAAVARFPELQHFYKRAPAGLEAAESMALSEASDPAVAEAIAQWVRQLPALQGK